MWKHHDDHLPKKPFGCQAKHALCTEQSHHFLNDPAVQITSDLAAAEAKRHAVEMDVPEETWLPFYYVPRRELPMGGQTACYLRLANVSLACHWELVLRTCLLPWGGGDVAEPNHSVSRGLLAPLQWDCPRPALLVQTPWIANELFPAPALIVSTTNCSPPPLTSQPLVVSNCVWRCRQ